MAAIRSFRDLEVYIQARQQAKNVFLVSKRFPRDERYSMTDQIRRSSRAVNAMIAEAWARRMYRAAFVNKIDEALARRWKLKHGSIMPLTVVISMERNTKGWMTSGNALAQC